MKMSDHFTLPFNNNHIEKPVLHAINCHDELVDTLDFTVKLLNNWFEDSEDMPTFDEMRQLKEVLAKAKG